MNAPWPDEIRALRKAAKLTQTQAAHLVHVALRTWQEWEGGGTVINGAAWELFQIKTRRLRGAH